MKKTLISVIWIVALISLVGGGLFCLFLYTMDSANTVQGTPEEWLNSSANELNLVVEYLTSYNESEIHIETDGTLRIGEYPTTRVEDVKDEEVVSAISVLRSKGYRHISRIDNTIRVVCKSKFRDFNSGIAYSINGEDEPKLTYLTKIEPLSEDGWYYYESDYNEWRINNR